MLDNIEDYYNTLAPRLTNYLVATGSTYETACEIVQDSFLKMWKMREDIDNVPEQVSALLWKIARNLRIDRYRRDKKVVLDEEAGVNEVAPVSESAGTDDRAYLRDRLSKALAQLPPLLREPYVMFHVAELSVREIAQQIGVTENVVKVRIFRAKEKLKELLKDLRTW